MPKSMYTRKATKQKTAANPPKKAKARPTVRLKKKY